MPGIALAAGSYRLPRATASKRSASRGVIRPMATSDKIELRSEFIALLTDSAKCSSYLDLRESISPDDQKDRPNDSENAEVKCRTKGGTERGSTEKHRPHAIN